MSPRCKALETRAPRSQDGRRRNGKKGSDYPPAASLDLYSGIPGNDTMTQPQGTSGQIVGHPHSGEKCAGSHYPVPEYDGLSPGKSWPPKLICSS